MQDSSITRISIAGILSTAGINYYKVHGILELKTKELGVNIEQWQVIDQQKTRFRISNLN